MEHPKVRFSKIYESEIGKNEDVEIKDNQSIKLKYLPQVKNKSVIDPRNKSTEKLPIKIKKETSYNIIGNQLKTSKKSEILHSTKRYKKFNEKENIVARNFSFPEYNSTISAIKKLNKLKLKYQLFILNLCLIRVKIRFMKR